MRDLRSPHAARNIRAGQLPRPNPAAHAEQPLEALFYAYTLESGAIAPAASGTASVQIQADAPFEFSQITGVVINDATGAIVAAPSARLQLTDTGSGANLFNAPIPWLSIVGDGSLPFILPVPRVIAANSSLQASFTNDDGAVTYRLRLVLPGRKLYRSR